MLTCSHQELLVSSNSIVQVFVHQVKTVIMVFLPQLPQHVPTRFTLGVMLFIACFVTYMLRVNISLNILAMVHSGTDQPDHGPRYNWTQHDQSLVLGSYFWGYLLTSLPGGYLAETYGGRHVVGVAMIISVFCTCAVPVLSQWGLAWVIAARTVTGAAAGPIYPCLHFLISRWAPPDEKGKFIAALMGGTFGTVLTWSIVGILIEKAGWDYAFYVPALIAIVMTICWYGLVYDTPKDHPRILKEERDYIENVLGESFSQKKKIAPYGSIITSVPFLALLVLHYGNLWGLYFLITAAPKFLNTVLGFNLAHSGLLASLPYLARMTFGFVFGSIGDVIRKKNVWQLTRIRKVFTIPSHVIPGLFLVGMCFVQQPYVCVALITLSLGFNGASTVTNLQNSQDLAPNFAGTLYGIINFVGTTTGFITPTLVAHFTKDQNTMNEWTYIFIIGAAAYIVPALVYSVFGSAKTQHWNDAMKEEEAAVPVEGTPAAVTPPQENLARV